MKQKVLSTLLCGRRHFFFLLLQLFFPAKKAPAPGPSVFQNGPSAFSCLASGSSRRNVQQTRQPPFPSSTRSSSALILTDSCRNLTLTIMDYQNRAGSKFGGGGVASQSATNADRRERLRKLALETIDLDK